VTLREVVQPRRERYPGVAGLGSLAIEARNHMRGCMAKATQISVRSCPGGKKAQEGYVPQLGLNS
jgi:hypothetical protein